MKFDELDERMRIFETANDHCVLPYMFMVARLDGRGFTRLTKEIHSFEAPFDEKFRDMMVETTKHLMNCGFYVLYAFTESDEMSLLFHQDENSFGRKTRKLNSILAGEASAKFSLLLGDLACFDCRISELPRVRDVIDYFRWRNEDAFRNALNAHCYWKLREEGKNALEASKFLENKSVAQKNELLFQRNINFNDLPSWQKRGIGIYWEDYEKESFHPQTQEKTSAKRRRLKIDLELPMKEAYSEFIAKLVDQYKSE